MTERPSRRGSHRARRPPGQPAALLADERHPPPVPPPPPEAPVGLATVGHASPSPTATPAQRDADWLFALTDDQSRRGDLARRRELKFALPGADVGALRELLSASCERKTFAGAVSTVRSIYFDDAFFSSARENLAGLGRRRKLRMRWYDRLRPGHQVFFEQKWRCGDVTGKRRYELACRWDVGDLPYAEIIEGMAATLPDDLAAFFRARCEPAVAVEYRREHFVVRGSGLRLTIDYDLVVYDESGQLRPRLLNGLALPGFVVLEGKVPVGQEEELRPVLRPFAPRVTRCSKYVTACGALGLVRVP